MNVLESVFWTIDILYVPVAAFIVVAALLIIAAAEYIGAMPSKPIDPEPEDPDNPGWVKYKEGDGQTSWYRIDDKRHEKHEQNVARYGLAMVGWVLFGLVLAAAIATAVLMAM